MDIYVGNLPTDALANDLRALFEKFGEVTDVRLVMDKSRGKPKNYGCPRKRRLKRPSRK